MCICGCCCKSLSLYFSLSSTSSGCCKSRYILLIFTKFSLNKSLLLGTYLMDKFFILRTLAASCVSLKKKREEKNITQLQQQKSYVRCSWTWLWKKSYSNKMHIELQWKQIGRWFYLSVAFFLSLTHLLIHSLTLHFHSFAPSSASMFSSRLIFIHVHALMIFIFILSTSGKK